jgi:hypothetical protein
MQAKLASLKDNLGRDSLGHGNQRHLGWRTSRTRTGGGDVFAHSLNVFR